MSARRAPIERLLEKIEVRGPDECWPWTGSRSRAGRGYGFFAYTREHIGYAHRAVLEIKLGRFLLPGEEALHSCDDPGCCNGAHLFVGTQADNVADMARKGRANFAHDNRRRGADHWNWRGAA